MLDARSLAVFAETLRKFHHGSGLYGSEGRSISYCNKATLSTPHLLLYVGDKVDHALVPLPGQPLALICPHHAFQLEELVVEVADGVGRVASFVEWTMFCSREGGAPQYSDSLVASEVDGDRPEFSAVEATLCPVPVRHDHHAPRPPPPLTPHRIQLVAVLDYVEFLASLVPGRLQAGLDPLDLFAIAHVVTDLGDQSRPLLRDCPCCDVRMEEAFVEILPGTRRS